ncbi:cardiolipin synthase [Cytobacillus purgationiresistens]|uniref:Cardiolipin synthase n=1 Tax=Cytobacillus purgationiresistens TaxID=863449 RepID=A0ABU0AN81_9BACI|nr:cardiolipin synthase [Cytobacillus purgationiresistens]MDQ0271520.1 cardiolipin synthase [Cytobacillus purgationiresistens]
MKSRRRIEFVFAFILVATLYICFFVETSKLIVILCLLFYLGTIFIIAYSIMLENRSPQHSLLWIYVIVFFPVFGYFFYLYSGQLYMKGYLFKSKRSSNREEWKNLMKMEDDPDVSFLQDGQMRFAEFAINTALTPMTTGSKAKVLKNGDATFFEIKRKLMMAKKFIHMEYYIFRSDRLGKEIIDILIERANNGVEVLFIYDAAGSMQLMADDITRMDKAGIKVKPFSPLKYGFFNQKFNFRNHRKIIIIDGEVGFTGGLNIGIEYLGQDESVGFWRDTHLLLMGEAVYTLHTIFLLDWEYISGEDVLEDYRCYRTTVQDEVLDGAVQVVGSGPDTQQGIMGDFYFSMISSAEQSIWIATPYLVPDEAIRTALRVAAAKGIEVRILVPEINDSFLTQYASRSYFPELLRYGVEIYSYKKGFLHQKIIIVDGNLASIGTANMDMRSFHLNFEVNVFLYGSSSIRDLVADFEDDMKESTRISPVQFYKRGFWEKSKESFARLFSGVL